MNRLLLSLLFTAASLLGPAYYATAQITAPTKQWDKTLGGSDKDILHSLQQTSDGGYLLGGSSASGISGDKTQPNQGLLSDYWIVKLTANGTKQWDRTFGSDYWDELNVLQQTSDGGYILGGIGYYGISGNKSQAGQGVNDYWVVKLDANGNKQWEKAIGTFTTDNLQALQQTSDGGYILGGTSLASINGDKTELSRGGHDYWVVKLDANGTKQWDRTLGGSGYEWFSSLQQTSDGGYILGGTSLSPISGDKTQANPGSSSYWVVKLDTNGSKQWDKVFGGRGTEQLSALQQTSDGGYIVGGRSDSPISGDKTQANRGIYDYWVVKLNASGTKQWDRTVGGNNDDELTNLQQTSDGGYILGGSSGSDISGDKTQANQGAPNSTDYWIVKLDAVGTKQWDRTVGAAGNDAFGALQQTRDGGYLLGGSSASGISGDKTQAGQGNYDYWLVKLAADPLSTKSVITRPALSAYPNPARTQFTLRGPLGTPYQLLNQLGQVVRAGTLSAQPLDVQALPAGLYLLRDAASGRTTKLVKE
jgi:hypothetical protein